MIRGNLEGSIRTTCPVQRRRCCGMVASRGSRARLRISLFESSYSLRVLSSCLKFLLDALKAFGVTTVQGPSFTGIGKCRKNDGPENHDFGADGYRVVVEDTMAKTPIRAVCSFYAIFNVLFTRSF